MCLIQYISSSTHLILLLRRSIPKQLCFIFLIAPSKSRTTQVDILIDAVTSLLVPGLPLHLLPGSQQMIPIR